MNQYRTGGASYHAAGYGVQVMQPMVGVEAAAAWWLAGGISPANAIGVYQPIGAASLAASYVNLANPGTYDLTLGVAPVFDAATGWTFTGSQYLNTGVVPTTGWSMILRFSEVVDGTTWATGMRLTSSERFHLTPSFLNTKIYGYGGLIQISPGLTAGTMAIAANACYANGVWVGATIGSITSAVSIYIGAINQGGAVNPFTGKIQALAIYNTTLSGAQVAALHAAMVQL